MSTWTMSYTCVAYMFCTCVCTQCSAILDGERYLRGDEQYLTIRWTIPDDGQYLAMDNTWRWAILGDGQYLRVACMLGVTCVAYMICICVCTQCSAILDGERYLRGDAQYLSIRWTILDDGQYLTMDNTLRYDGQCYTMDNTWQYAILEDGQYLKCLAMEDT
jgi:hypothetical protein